MPKGFPEPTQEQWDSARAEGKLLEKQIAELVEAFEQKHKPIQVNVLTRYRLYTDKYSLKNGGAAQIKLHDRSSAPELPNIIISQLDVKNGYIIDYAEDMV